MDKELIDYFDGDELAASVWLGKYALKDNAGIVVEKTPMEMHVRMAKEFARIERRYKTSAELDPETWNKLSHFGRHMNQLDEFAIFKYFDKFKYIIPQGSIMSALGNYYKLQSLSNCFVINSPYDSYGGIFKTDQEVAQLEKRRGGVGMNLNTLRPDDTPVMNAAGTSTGAHSFMERYSNTTREVAQNGRRGALMLLMSVIHPDIFKFVTKKKDRTKVTGANVSVQLTNAFMEAVETDSDFMCRFPIDDFNYKYAMERDSIKELEYNKLIPTPNLAKELGGPQYVMKIRAKELYDLIVEMAWDNAEPGIAFMDNVISYSPDGVYERFKAIASNPCGEQWLSADDACRLLAANLASFVRNAFTKDSNIDWDKMYEVFYIQQRLADDIVDLEIEYVQQIILKIEKDPEPDEIKATELNLWKRIKEMATASRRTGCGFTGLADMLAMLNLKYDSSLALAITEQVMKTKLRAELDCTTDLAATRGTFEGWDGSKEFSIDNNYTVTGKNPFYQMIADQFPEQVERMMKYGRRNVSWSTVAPTGSVSILTQTTSGLEPLFLPYYMRRKKVNPSDKNVRVDFVDQTGDSWQEYPVLHPKFKDWILTIADNDDLLVWGYPERWGKIVLDSYFQKSPWYGACANDIAWEKRVELQSIIQKYTTNAISSTMNLPKDVSKETVSNIYFSAWKHGLKGITIYRDGCRTGVLVAEPTKVTTNEFGYSDAIKRPKELEAQLHVVTVRGQKYGVAIGFLNESPYEVFAFPATEDIRTVKGRIVKVKRGHYDFLDGDVNVKNLQTAALHAEEQMLTRLVSGMLRHGMNPYFIIDQINKTPLEVVSFGKALTRVLKQYIKDEELKGKMKCNECGGSNIRLEEGCSKCMDCGSSKCG